MNISAFLIIVLLSFSSLAFSEELTESANNKPPVKSLDALLKQVKQHQGAEKKRYQLREKKFKAAKSEQENLLKQAKADFINAQKSNNPLQQASDEKAKKIANLKQELAYHVNDLGNINQSFQQFAGDFTASMQGSLVQTELVERNQALLALADQNQLANIDNIRRLWVLMQEEMIKSGQVTSYTAAVIEADGLISQKPIVRVGAFSAVADNQLLQYLPQSQELLSLSRQPAGLSSNIKNTQNIVADSINNSVDVENLSAIVIDPTRGSLLSVLGKSPSIKERILQGKEVGFAIIALAICGIFFAIYRIAILLLLATKIKKQLTNIDNPSSNNPLGRILLEVKNKPAENSLQVSLDEAILKELPRLEFGHSLIKLLAAVAPLMGLLGTVIGMIATFQSISLFGSGDPKLMAGGISQALITTVLGLLAAIPLLFLHNIVSALSQNIIQILDEQSAGLLVASQTSVQQGEAHVVE